MIIKIYHILIAAEIIIKCELHHYDYYHGKNWRNPYYRSTRESFTSSGYDYDNNENKQENNFYVRRNGSYSGKYTNSNSNYGTMPWWYKWWTGREMRPDNDESTDEKIKTETRTNTSEKPSSSSLSPTSCSRDLVENIIVEKNINDMKQTTDDNNNKINNDSKKMAVLAQIVISTQIFFRSTSICIYEKSIAVPDIL